MTTEWLAIQSFQNSQLDIIIGNKNILSNAHRT